MALRSVVSRVDEHVKTGKAYISSLGTTGLLVASSVLLLVVVGALVAFDRWPAGSSTGQADAVIVGGPDRVVAERKASAERRRAGRRRAARARAERRRARAAARRAVQAGEGVTALPGDPVVSGLPAPDSGSGGGSPSAGAGGGRALAPAQGGGAAPGGGAPASGAVGDVVSGVNPQVGQAVSELGETAGGTLDAPLDPLGPGIAP